MKKIIVFFDIDGTLYDRSDPRKIPESTRRAICKLQESGKSVIVCTGRCFSCIEPYLLEFGFDGFIAGCGTHIIYQKQELSRYAWDNSKIKMLDQFCKRQGLIPIFEGSDFLYIDKADCIGSAAKMYHFYDSFYKGKLRPIDHQAKDICKMTIRYIPDKDRKNGIDEKRISKRISSVAADLSGKAMDRPDTERTIEKTDKINTRTIWKEVPRSDTEMANRENRIVINETEMKKNIGVDNEASTSALSHWNPVYKAKMIRQLKAWGLTALDKGDVLEVFPEGYGKGEGIRKFLEMTGQKEAETYAFGDGVNDISMMEQVDYGVAVGDADEKLLKACYLQTDGVYQDGIYTACQKLHLI